MSVFQLQEWWSVKMAEDEEFDHGCMVVGNIDNADPPTEKIAVGSMQGMLRIYAPSKPQFRVEDLILEESLGLPILQLLLGRFIPSSTTLGLAVLHPQKLVVYELMPQGNILDIMRNFKFQYCALFNVCM
jgi:Bardet-Biedl syndrome 9 protein